MLGKEYKICLEFETHFVERNFSNNKVEIIIFDNFINSSTLDNDFKNRPCKSPFNCLFDN